MYENREYIYIYIYIKKTIKINNILWGDEH
jgi:hypothetical protein